MDDDALMAADGANSVADELQPTNERDMFIAAEDELTEEKVIEDDQSK